MHADKLVEKARDASERRAYDLAIELYMQAVTLEPDHLEARRGLRHAELEKAKIHSPGGFSRMANSLPGRIGSFFAGLTKSHEKRMLSLEKVLAADPRNVKVGEKLARAAIAAGYRNAAIAAYEGVIEADPKHIEAHRGLGRLYHQTGDPHSAIKAYERALEIDPRDQEATRRRKDLAAEVSIAKSGLDRGEHSRDLLRDRDQQKNLEDRQRVMRGTDELMGAVHEIEQKLAEDPGNASLRAELGSRYAALKDYDRAVESYEKALKITPDHFPWREKAGDLRILRYDRDLRAAEEAKDEAETVRLRRERSEYMAGEYRARVAHHPTDLALRFLLGKALYEVGKTDEAISEFQQTVKDPRRKLESLTMLGNCFLEKGEYDLAENQLRRALEETPGMTSRTKEILYSLGLLMERRQKPEDALAEYRKIYEVDINYRDVSQKLTALREKAGS